eukprot:scaffold102006_cov51-Prasinocladus_malaysianus.AAC.2
MTTIKILLSCGSTNYHRKAKYEAIKSYVCAPGSPGSLAKACQKCVLNKQCQRSDGRDNKLLPVR